MVKNNFLKEKNLNKNNNGPDPIYKNKNLYFRCLKLAWSLDHIGFEIQETWL